MPSLSLQTQAGAVLLLLVIVQFSAGRLQSKYNDIHEGRALVAEHPGLIDLLQEAWSNSWSCQSFKKIRNLKILNVPSKSKLSTGEQMYNSAQSLAISTAWKEQYRGEYHKKLYSTLNRMQHSSPYSNTVSIIQSSGSGKSRMVDNMARLVFTIPFNIRFPKDPQVLPFPPPDVQISIFLTQPGIHSIDALHAYYLLFLRHVFEEIRKVLKRSFSKSESNCTTLATSWRCHLESDGTRQSLYDSVVQAFKKVVLLQQDATICEEEVTGPLILVKTQKMRGNATNYEADENTIKNFPHSENTRVLQRPYISLVMELDIQPPSDVNTRRPKKKTKERRVYPAEHCS